MVWRKSINRDHIHPILVRVMDKVLERLKQRGEPFKIYSGTRTFREQDKLYAKGRSQSGPVVTQAKPGQSMHNYGLAVDLAPFHLVGQGNQLWWPELEDRGGLVWFHLENVLLEVTQDLKIELDIEWGGRWQFRDVPHIQIRTTVRELKTGYYPPAPIEWLDYSHRTFLRGSPWLDRRAQYLLNQLGYNAGPVDGLVGDRTKMAIVGAGFDHVGSDLLEYLVDALLGP